MSQEPLQLMPKERWLELQPAFLSDWPRGLPGYNVLETQLRWKEHGVDYGIQMYCLYGDVRNGFIAVNEKASYYEIIIQYPNDDTKVLEEALRATKVIDWERRIILPFTANNVITCVKKLVEEKQIEISMIPSHSFIWEKNSPMFADICLPAGLEFKPLSLEHIELVDSKWPHRYPSSSWYFQLLINAKAGYGLFKDGNLISWTFIGESGNLTHLYTLEAHRRKGYAELILKLVSNEILKMNTDVFAFCVKGNDSAYKLYHKVGFAKSVDVSWYYLTKKLNLN